MDAQVRRAAIRAAGLLFAMSGFLLSVLASLIGAFLPHEHVPVIRDHRPTSRTRPSSGSRNTHRSSIITLSNPAPQSPLPLSSVELRLATTPSRERSPTQDIQSPLLPAFPPSPFSFTTVLTRETLPILPSIDFPGEVSTRPESLPARLKHRSLEKSHVVRRSHSTPLRETPSSFGVSSSPAPSRAKTFCMGYKSPRKSPSGSAERRSNRRDKPPPAPTPAPRTRPYEAPYFFPSPTSPAAETYAPFRKLKVLGRSSTVSVYSKGLPAE